MTFTYTHEAHLVKGYLESNGIETILNDEYTTQVVNIYSSAIGGVKLLVRESDYSQGIQLLKDGGYLQEEGFKSGSKTEVILSDKTTNKKICPFCGSDNIALNKNPGVFVTILLAIVSLLLTVGATSPRIKSAFLCFDCSKEWKYKSE